MRPERDRAAAPLKSGPVEALSEAELDLLTLLVLKGVVDRNGGSKSNTSSSSTGNTSGSTGAWAAAAPWPAWPAPPPPLAFAPTHKHGDAARAGAEASQRAQAAEFAAASGALLSLAQEALASGRAAAAKERELLRREADLSRREVCAPLLLHSTQHATTHTHTVHAQYSTRHTPSRRPPTEKAGAKAKDTRSERYDFDCVATSSLHSLFTHAPP